MRSKEQKNSVEQQEIFQVKAKKTRSLPLHEKYDFTQMTFLEILAYYKHRKRGK